MTIGMTQFLKTLAETEPKKLKQKTFAEAHKQPKKPRKGRGKTLARKITIAKARWAGR